MSFKRNAYFQIDVLDNDEDENFGDFECTSELIEFIKDSYPEYFTICVAGNWILNIYFIEF